MRLEPITAANWRAAGALQVARGQLGLADEYEPVAYALLARSYVRQGGAEWRPFAAYDDSRLVGVLALVDEGPTWELRGLVIDARHQQQGHGRAAVTEAISCARERGAQQLQLSVPPTNLIARHLVESLGFTALGDADMRLSLAA